MTLLPLELLLHGVELLDMLLFRVISCLLCCGCVLLNLLGCLLQQVVR